VVLAPCLGGVGDHGDDGVVVLFVFVVEEDELGPEVSLVGGTQHFRDIDTRPGEMRKVRVKTGVSNFLTRKKGYRISAYNSL